MNTNQKNQLRLICKLATILIIAILGFAFLYFKLGPTEDGLKTSLRSITSYADCIYFSIVTISTLGYGDITPYGWSKGISAIEVLFGLFFVGYSISQVVSSKQEALIEYLANDRITQTYDICLTGITDAKELIGDQRRLIQARLPISSVDFLYYRGNPFYPAMRAMEVLNGYTAHVVEIGKQKDLLLRIERAAHHVEELSGFIRKLLNLLVDKKVEWHTHRTHMILTRLCDEIDSFREEFLAHTRYTTHPYKNGGDYAEIVKRISYEIRQKLTKPIVKQHRN
ncbi:two pore domain potassium channel family protein [Oxalobacteraceae bacterium CAVE-383]|nr:two pore domain potassium channel family protein [Oxalobacteraceae bacterium CAVE-383]